MPGTVARVKRNPVRFQYVQGIFDFGKGSIASRIGGRAAKKPNFRGLLSLIEAAARLTLRARVAAAGPLRIMQPGAVREITAVLMLRFSISCSVEDNDHSGSFQLEGSPRV